MDAIAADGRQWQLELADAEGAEVRTLRMGDRLRGCRARSGQREPPEDEAEPNRPSHMKNPLPH